MITERQIEFCRRICGLAAEFGLYQLEGKFRLGFSSPSDSREEVTFSWDAGRHGADSNEIYVNSIEHLHLKVNGPKRRAETGS